MRMKNLSFKPTSPLAFMPSKQDTACLSRHETLCPEEAGADIWEDCGIAMAAMAPWNQ